MFEDYQEKTEQPTKKRLKEVRQKGHVFKSHDTTVSGMLLFNMFFLLIFSKFMFLKIYFMFKGLLNNLNYDIENPQQIIHWMNEGIFYLQVLLAPLLLGTLAAACIVNLSQVGFVFSATPLKPRWSNLNMFDGQNYKKYFDFRVILKIILGQLRIIAVTVSSIWLIAGDIFSIYELTDADPKKVIMYIFVKAMEIGFVLAISYLLIGLIELAYNRYRYYKDLRMTPRELRDEIRHSEGNLEVRAQIYSFMKKFLGKPTETNLSQAAVIITSTTHGISLALMFYPETMDAPLCIAKGILNRSKEILLQAQIYDIPIIEDIALSKRLYGVVKIGQFVPSLLYYEVAEILVLADKKRKMLQSIKRQPLGETTAHA